MKNPYLRLANANIVLKEFIAYSQQKNLSAIQGARAHQEWVFANFNRRIECHSKSIINVLEKGLLAAKVLYEDDALEPMQPVLEELIQQFKIIKQMHPIEENHTLTKYLNNNYQNELTANNMYIGFKNYVGEEK